MKTSIKLILLSLGLFALNANAANPTFNHKGIQKGATSSSCYRNPCSVVKVMDFKLLVTLADFKDGKIVLKKGKKAFKQINLV